MANPFVHLHLHTEYSLLDGAVRIDDIFKRCGELGMPAVAMTDHGNMFAACKFDAAAAKYTLGKKLEMENWRSANIPYKVKPIFGCEMYVCDDMDVKTSVGSRKPKLYHLVLLAKNYQGFLSLCKLNSEAYVRGFYYKPRIDHEFLSAHTEGLICLSACLGGEIPQALLAGDYQLAKQTAVFYRDLFGADNFYIELQDHDFIEQKQINPLLIKLAREIGVKFVATNDVHYLNKNDAEMQKVLQCISFKRQITDTLGNGDETYFPTQEFYLKSYDEMAERFGYVPEALSNTLEIADKCECWLKYKQDLIPASVPPTGMTNAEFLVKMTYDGLAEKYPEVTSEIKARADYELSTITNLGYVDYFLIVWDFIHHAESIGIPVGPGRGSGVGSIVAYAIGITKVDPLKYALYFERFLNAERVSMPDFDIDFCFERRGDVIQYVIDKYGADKVSQIVTFGTLAIKAAIKDVGRVYGMSFAETDKINKSIPRLNPTSHTHLTDLLGRNPNKKDMAAKELIEMYESNEEARKVLDMACKIEGIPRQTGMHAAGVVICKEVIADVIPQARSGEDITTQFDAPEVEKLGMLKMDFLGLRTLTDISKAVELIEKNHGVHLDFYKNFGYDDPKVFELISTGDTHAVFQLESEGMKNFMRKLRPTSLEDIIAGISLFRPGPMASIDDYVRNKNNPDKVEYAAPCLEHILDVTYGCIVYQEQVMKIAQEMAGYSLGGADILRRAMSKKKVEDVEAHRKIFIHGGVAGGVKIEGAVSRGIPEEVANSVYDKIRAFAEYAFNKSHATAYAYLSYQTAYLKCYYKAEFITAVLNNRITNADELKNYLPYARNSGMTIYPPSVNHSDCLFTVENGGIRIGLSAIKNVGVGIMEKLVEERTRDGAFKDAADFFKRMSASGVNKKAYESLILAGALDCFDLKRAQLMQCYAGLADKYAADRAVRATGQYSMFDLIEEDDQTQYPDVEEFEYHQKLKYEKELMGMYVSGHPLDQYREALSAAAMTTELFFSTGEDEDGAKMYDNVTDGQYVKLSGMLTETRRILTKRNDQMGAAKLEDLCGTAEIMFAPRTYQSCKDKIVPDTMVTVTGKVSVRDGFEPVVWVDKIARFEGVAEDMTAERTIERLYLKFDVCGISPQKENELDEILSVYSGETEVRLVDAETRKTYPCERKVKICQALIGELSAKLGSDNVRVQRSKVKA